MRILITGSRGQLGNELKRCLTSMSADIGPIDAAYAGAQVDYLDADTLDISDGHAVTGWFADHGPYDLVINGAAFTNVDGCEANEAMAYKVNALGPMYLARAVARTGGKYLHVSTDYVFPGTEPGSRVESDAALPISAYGRTKWAGEVLAADACERTFVVRTAWLYGYVGRNFVKTMLGLAEKFGEISVVADQVGNPTNANDLAYVLLALGLTENYGTYHATNNGECSWFEFASAVLDLAGVDVPRHPLTSAEYKERFPASADRPAYSSLRNAHLEQTVGDPMRSWQDALKSYMENLPELGDRPL